MSHFTKITVQVKNEEYLQEALKEMGFSTVKDAPIRGYAGRTKKADFVVKLPGQYDIGFLKAGEEYDVIADWSMLGSKYNQRDFTQRLQREYAAAAAVAEAKKKGYRVEKRVVDEQGRIQITAQKY